MHEDEEHALGRRHPDLPKKQVSFSDGFWASQIDGISVSVSDVLSMIVMRALVGLPLPSLVEIRTETHNQLTTPQSSAGSSPSLSIAVELGIEALDLLDARSGILGEVVRDGKSRADVLNARPLAGRA